MTADEPRHRASGALLECDVCRRTGGTYPTYEAWEDAARAQGWEVGDELVICDQCSGAADDG